jgi:hypothetical protein
MKGGINLYAYCRGNPIMSRDPSGTQEKPPLTGLFDPKIGKVWEGVVTKIIGPRYGTKTYEGTEAAFRKDIAQRIEKSGGSKGHPHGEKDLQFRTRRIRQRASRDGNHRRSGAPLVGRVKPPT